MNRAAAGTGRRVRLRPFSSAALVVALAAAPLGGVSSAVIPTDGAFAAEGDATSSAVTLTNRENALEPDGAPFPDLEVTVSQTKDLVSQGIRVSWKGGTKSERPSSSVGGTNFLQIAQCWGEDPDHPGHPDRRTCQYGGTLSPGSYRDGNTDTASVAPEDMKYTEVSEDFFRPTYTGIPFVAVNPENIVDERFAPADRVLTNLTTNAAGDTVQKTGSAFVDLNTNPFFTAYSTNEVRWAGAGEDGSGSVPFEVQTNTQSTALGCGTPIEQVDGSVIGQSCWLVIIPRGQGDSGSPEINRSGLWWDAWEHHVAVKLEFKPLGVRCDIGQAERQLAGSELIADAMASWQPRLCQQEGGVPFVLSQGREADAVVKAAGMEPSPLAFTSRPLDLSRAGVDSDPLAYAPVALSGVAISFAVDRQPDPQNASPEEKARAGLPLSELRLTPRLVAKLLTASYLDSLPSGADISHIGYKSFADPGHNPRTIVQDQEFQAINDPEWSHQIIVGASVADALMPSGRSDLAVRVWEYVMSDAKARAWLNGEPDEYGMIVNPYFSTNPEKNPTGVGLALPTDSFPKADPVEKPDTTVTDPANGTGPINLVTWRPYTSSYATGAYLVLRGDGQELGAWDKFAVPPKFGRSVRELFGTQRVIGLTTAPAAELYQTATASLLNPAGEYVAPTREGIAAAAAAMTPNATQPAVQEYAFASDAARDAPTSYPLAMPVYAVLNPNQTDAGLRATYANLIRYAAGEGQHPGTEIGDLPAGYAPLPDAWADLARSAADAIERGAVPAVGAGGATGHATVSSTSASTVRAPTLGSSTPAPSAAPPIDGPADAADGGGESAGAATPDDPAAGALAAAVPIGVGGGVAAALAAALVTFVRRRA